MGGGYLAMITAQLHKGSHFVKLQLSLAHSPFISHNVLKGRVHLPGARPDVATPLSAMNVFVLTSEFERTPNVLLEAQWLGVPIVATDAGCTKESFRQDEAGLLATLSSPESLASFVAIYLTDDRMRAHANEAGPKFIAEAFGVARMIDETLDLYGVLSSQFTGSVLSSRPSYVRISHRQGYEVKT